MDIGLQYSKNSVFFLFVCELSKAVFLTQFEALRWPMGLVTTLDVV